MAAAEAMQQSTCQPQTVEQHTQQPAAVNKQAALANYEQVRQRRLEEGSWSAEDEEEYRLLSLVMGGRWRL